MQAISVNTLLRSEFDMQRPKVIRDQAFADRLNEAADAHPHVADLQHGRLTWVKKHLKERYSESVSVETVRKWFGGAMRPKPQTMRALAALLEVDEAWLSLGIKADMEPRERRLRNAMADAAVNILTGLIQMDGGTPAFPEEGDRRAERLGIDLYAIIRGANYAIHVSTAKEIADGQVKFTVPTFYDEMMVVGFVRRSTFEFDLLDMSAEMIREHGVPRGGFVEVTADIKDGVYSSNGQPWARIEGFARRI